MTSDYDKLLAAKVNAEARKFVAEQEACESKAQPRVARVVKVDRDESGIRYSDNGTSSVPAPATPKPPIQVRSKQAAEKLGWVFIATEPEHVREVAGTAYLEKVPGRYVAEYSGSFRPDDLPRTHRQTASSLEGLLRNIEDFETRRR